MKNLAKLLFLSAITLDQVKADQAKSKDEASDLIHGRNRDGKFKNHDHYLQVLNELNIAEHTHQEMFDGIQKKLQDEEFIKLQGEKGDESSGLSIDYDSLDDDGMLQTSAATTDDFFTPETSGMSDAEADAYIRRYDDVGIDPGNDGNRNILRKHWVTWGKEQKRNKNVETDLDDKQAVCYYQRYDDTQKLWAGWTSDGKSQADKIGLIKDHWKTKGIKQGRQRHCAGRISKFMAHCYLDKYPDLKKAFGWNVNSWIKAEEHWYNFGMKEGRDPMCPGKQAYKCGNEGDSCACPVGSHMYYGNRYNMDKYESGANQTEPSQMISWKHSMVESYSSSMKCSNGVMGNPLYGWWKSCFCEPRPTLPPIQLSEEGGQHVVPKVKGKFVYYGRLSNGNGTLSFKEMTRDKFLRTDKLIPDAPPNKGKQYRGNQFMTRSGYTCQKWDDQSPHKHTRGPKWRKNKGVDGGHNFCRNPDGEGNTMWCYTTNPKKRWEYCDPEPKNCTTSDLGFKDPLPGVRKQCYYDAEDYYGSASYKQDVAAYEAKEKAEQAAKDAEGLKEKREAAEAKRLAAEQALKLAQAKAKREREAAEAEAKRNWYRDQKNALETEKAAREAQYEKALKRQDKAQAKEIKAERLRFQAAKARRQYNRARKARRRANAKDKVKLAIEAHARKAQMIEMMQQSKLQKAQAADAQKKIELAEELEEKRLAAAAIQSQINMVNSKNDEVAQAASDAAKMQANQVAAAERATAEEAETKRTEAATQKAVQQALEEFQARQAAKQKREAEEQEEEVRKSREEAATKAAAEKAKAEAYQAAREAAQEAARAARAAKIQGEKDALLRRQEADAEKKRLENEQFAQQKAAAEAAQRQIEATKNAALAKSTQEQEEAQAASDAAAKEVQEAEDRRKKLEEDKQALIDKREADEKRQQAAIEAANKADQDEKEAAEKAARWADQEQATKERTAIEEERARAAAQAETERIQAEYEANQKRRDDAAAAQKLAIQIAEEAAQKAHDAAEVKRKEQEARQAADLEAKMAKRRNKFKALYEHVWMSGPTEISMINLHVPDNLVAENLMEVLFYDNLIADCEIIQNHIHRSYLVDGKIVTEDGDHEMLMMTSNDRLDDALKRIAEKIGNNNHDAMVTSPATGNKNYINWVKQQTVVPDFLTNAESATDTNSEVTISNSTVPEV